MIRAVVAWWLEYHTSYPVYISYDTAVVLLLSVVCSIFE